MDRFEYFVRYLTELCAKKPEKLVGDAAIGYWQAIHSITRAAQMADHAVTGVEKYEPWLVTTVNPEPGTHDGR